MIGPFDMNPLGDRARFFDVDAIPKRDLTDLHIIMNLSYDSDAPSVNSAIDKDFYLGAPTKLIYPSIEDLVRLIKKKGQGCLLFKCDLWKCYRQIFMDPSIPLLGFVIDEKMYFDVVLSMGLCIACYICQRITNSLMFAYKRLSYEGINYLDDLGAAEVQALAEKAFQVLGEMLAKLGIWEPPSKASPPSTVLVFLGVRCDSVKFTLEITQDRLAEITGNLNHWLTKEWATLKEVQSLAGKLNFMHTSEIGLCFHVPGVGVPV